MLPTGFGSRRHSHVQPSLAPTKDVNHLARRRKKTRTVAGFGYFALRTLVGPLVTLQSVLRFRFEMFVVVSDRLSLFFLT